MSQEAEMSMRSPRKTSLDFSSQLQAQSNITSITTVLDNVQQQHKYTNNKCVRCLTHALATRPAYLLEFVDKLALYICHHETGELRESRSFVKAQHNFLSCMERLYKAAEKSSRRPSETITSIAAAAASAMMDAEDDMTDASSGSERVDGAMLSPVEPTQAEVVLPILCQVMHKLVGQDALEGSILLKWYAQGSNVSEVLRDDESARFRDGLANFMTWLEMVEEDEEDEEEDCDEDFDDDACDES
eukprot:m.33375 g.33375  ORF g.33375 m.33375 type:complete len:245 (+) comp12227_c0_seq1:132-866(+)